MFNTGSFNPCAKVVSHFILVAAVKLAAKECGDILGFNQVNGGANDFVVDRLEIPFSFEDYVSSVFYLHKAPVIVIDKIANDWAVLSDYFIQLTMNTFNIYVISKLLSLVNSVNCHKGIVENLEINILLAESGSQQVVSVTVELQPKRHTCRYSQITQSQLGINKVEIIMQTFAGYRLEICFVSPLIVSGFIGCASLHSRVNVYQSGMHSALGDNIVNAVFFTKNLFSNKFDFQAVFQSDSFGIFSGVLSQRLSPLGVVENTNTLLTQKQAHTVGVTNARYGSGQYDPVKTGDDPLDFTVVLLDNVLHCFRSPYRIFQFEELSGKCRAALRIFLTSFSPTTPD